MFGESLAAGAAIALIFMLAGFVKGTVGMGLPTVAMSLLAVFFPPAQAAAMLVIPSLVTNIWQLLAGPQFTAVAKRFATMMAGVVVGTFFGIGILTGDSMAVTNGILGAVLATYGLMGLFTVRLDVAPAWEPWLSPIVGLVTGVLSGATGVFAVPAVLYFSALKLDRDDLIQALGLSFTISTIALAVALGTRGMFRMDTAYASLLALVPTLVGMTAGQRVRERLHPRVFRRWFLVSLVMLGVYMLLRAALS
jgi:uncharacterized protein